MVVWQLRGVVRTIDSAFKSLSSNRARLNTWKECRAVHHSIFLNPSVKFFFIKHETQVSKMIRMLGEDGWDGDRMSGAVRREFCKGRGAAE